MAATELAPTEQAKTIHVYRNGDIFFAPKKFVLNKRIRNFDAFLDVVTTGIKPAFGSVRRLHTPVHGHKVSQLEDIEPGKKYVAVGAERFKRMGYEAIPDGGVYFGKKGSGQTSPREIKPVVHSRLKTSGRIRKIHNEPVTIFVYTNGDILRPASRVLLKKRELNSWNQTLTAIAERVTLRTGAVRWLFTLEGSNVQDPTSLKNADFYIGVGTERLYKELIPQYGQHPALQLSPRSERRKLPPIRPARRRFGKSNPGSENSRSLNNSLESSSNSNKSKGRRPKREEDEVFHARPVKHKRSPENKNRPTNYDNDEGGVYKSHQQNSETAGAREVDDSKDTRTELPIDQVPAEEVKETQVKPDRGSAEGEPNSVDATKKPSKK